MKRRRTLIASPLTWQMTAAPVPPAVHPILAERGGTQLNTPRPVVVVDTREQNPFSFDRFSKWFSGIERRALALGDYSIAGMEETCTVERKDLSDLIHSLSTERSTFLNRLRRMSLYPQRLLIITAAVSQVKSPHPYSRFDPNTILQSLVAGLAGLGIPFLCTETHELGEEVVASYLYQVSLYQWLEQNGFDRVLVDSDL
jgi:ERCC4-type nuclease